MHVIEKITKETAPIRIALKLSTNYLSFYSMCFIIYFLNALNRACLIINIHILADIKRLHCSNYSGSNKVRKYKVRMFMDKIIG